MPLERLGFVKTLVTLEEDGKSEVTIKHYAEFSIKSRITENFLLKQTSVKEK